MTGGTATTGKSLATAAAARVLARILSSAALGVTLILLARGTTVPQFGEFMVAYSVGMVVGILAGFGAPARALRAAAEDDEALVLRSLYTAHSAAVATVAVLAAGWGLATGASAALVAGGLFAVGDTVQNYAQAHLAGMGRQTAASALIVVQRLVPLAALLWSLTGGQQSVTALACAYAAVAALGLAVPLPSAVRTRGRWAGVLRSGGGYWSYNAAGLLTQLQVPVLAAVSTTTIVGLYSAAAKVVGPLTIFSAAVSTVVVPELARRVGTPGFDALYRLFSRATYGYLLLVLLATWPLTVVVVALLGPQYQPAWPLVAAMTVGAGLSACSQAGASKLVALGRPAPASRAILAGGVVGVLLLLAVAAAHHDGALWTVPVAAELVVLALMSASARAATEPPRPPGGNSDTMARSDTPRHQGEGPTGEVPRGRADLHA